MTLTWVTTDTAGRKGNLILIWILTCYCGRESQFARQKKSRSKYYYTNFSRSFFFVLKYPNAKIASSRRLYSFYLLYLNRIFKNT